MTLKRVQQVNITKRLNCYKQKYDRLAQFIIVIIFAIFIIASSATSFASPVYIAKGVDGSKIQSFSIAYVIQQSCNSYDNAYFSSHNIRLPNNDILVEYLYRDATTGTEISSAIYGMQQSGLLDFFGGSDTFVCRLKLFSLQDSLRVPSYQAPVVANYVITVTYTEQCVAGQASTLGNLTTIASYTPAGIAVAAGSVRNPQCDVNRCVTQYSSTDSAIRLTCDNYGEPWITREVGDSIYVLCKTGVFLTGKTCNFQDADQQATDTPEFSQSYVLLNNGSNGQGSVSSGGLSTADEATLNRIDATTSATKSELDTITGLESQIASNTASTASNTLSLGAKLDSLARNQGTAETNDDSRHTELINSLNNLLGKLSSIDGKTGTGTGDGSGTGTTIGDGTSSGGSTIGDVPFDVPANDGMLSIPGEKHTGFASLLNTSIASRASGNCPSTQFRIEYFNTEFNLDSFCDLWTRVSPIISAVMLISWSFAGLIIVLKA